jgi:hypothetical protein
LDFSYFYDENTQNIRQDNIPMKLNIINNEDRTQALKTFSFKPSKVNFTFITYLFNIVMKPGKNQTVDYISTNIEITSNLDNQNNTYIRYSYFYPPYTPDSGNLKNTFFNLFGGNEYLITAGVIMFLTYMIIFVASLIWQKFEIAGFIYLLYVFISIIILFWYILEVIANPSVLDFPFIDRNWGFLNSLKSFIIITLSIFQWTFTIGIILVIMFIITKSLGALFSLEKMNGNDGGILNDGF